MNIFQYTFTVDDLFGDILPIELKPLFVDWVTRYNEKSREPFGVTWQCALHEFDALDVEYFVQRVFWCYNMRSILKTLFPEREDLADRFMSGDDSAWEEIEAEWDRVGYVWEMSEPHGGETWITWRDYAAKIEQGSDADFYWFRSQWRVGARRLQFC